MKTKFLIFLIIISAHQIFSQKQNNVIAKVGNKTITAKEFKIRYELTPQVNRKHKDDKTAKEEFLYSLIAEDLFALEAERLGYDTLKQLQSTYQPLEKMFVRDALYKKEIKNKVTINEKKMNEGMKRANRKLYVDYLFSLNEEKIKFAYKLLTESSDFDSLATLLGKEKEIEYEQKPYEVTFGKMTEDAERKIYSLNLNEFTKPIEAPEGWYIFRLLKSEPAVLKNPAEKFSFVKKILKERTEDSIYKNYWQSFFRNKKITTEGNLFWYLAENLQKQIAAAKEKNKIKNGAKITVTAKDFIQLKKTLSADSLKKIFIKIPGNPLTLEDFLNDFMFEGFYTYTTKLKTIAAQLNSRVKRQIELELLAAEAYGKGMESLPEVKNETEIWKTNYLATLYKRNFIRNAKLTDEDLKNYLKQNSKKPVKETEVNIIEITTDNLEEIEKILKAEQNGTDFEELAKKYKKHNGKIESGFFSVTENKEIGTIAETMKPGDIYGPLKTEKGYTVFKLIDKKKSNLSEKISELDERTKKKIRYRKILESLENKTAELAEKYKVTINKSLLNTIKVINEQMIVFRYMGFGGRILAFPNVMPFYQWKEKWEQKKKDLL